MLNRYFCAVNPPGAHRTRRGAVAGLLAAVLVATSVAAAGQWVEAQMPAEADRGGAVEELAALVVGADELVGVSGNEAVELLEQTGTTELAAENAGMESAELVDELIDDPTMFVTAQAMVGYLDVAPTTAELTAAAGARQRPAHRARRRRRVRPQLAPLVRQGDLPRRRRPHDNRRLLEH